MLADTGVAIATGIGLVGTSLGFLTGFWVGISHGRRVEALRTSTCMVCGGNILVPYVPVCQACLHPPSRRAA